MATIQALIDQGILDASESGAELSEPLTTITYRHEVLVEVWYHQEVSPAWHPGSWNQTLLEVFTDGTRRYALAQADICRGNNCSTHSKYFSLPGQTTSFALQLNYTAGKWSAMGNRWNWRPQLKIVADGVVAFDQHFEMPLNPDRRTLAQGTVTVNIQRL